MGTTFYTDPAETNVLVDGHVTSSGSTGRAFQGEFTSLSMSSSAYVFGTSNGIYLSGSSATYVTNSGTIANGPQGGGSGTEAAIYATNSLILDNHGIIENLRRNELSSDKDAILHVGTGSSSYARIENSGTILGNITLSGGHDRITNFGIIDGYISLGDGNDSFTQLGGTLNGYIFGGDGNDTYVIDDPHLRIGEAADEGYDRVESYACYTLDSWLEVLVLKGDGDISGTGSFQDNHLIGNSGDNILRGKQGDDTFTTSTGVDVIRGGAGEDTLDFYNSFYGVGISSSGVKVKLGKAVWTASTEDPVFSTTFSSIENLLGTEYSDTLVDDNGDNVLNGLAGKDKLIGKGGDDVLIASSDSNIMIGGPGSDTFKFTGLRETDAAENAHVIKDFKPGEDKIDLSHFAQYDDLTFITGNFTGASQEVRYNQKKGMLQFVGYDDDVNLVIILKGRPELTVDDPILA